MVPFHLGIIWKKRYNNDLYSDQNATFDSSKFESPPDYGPITFEDKRIVMGGNSPLAGSPDGLAGLTTGIGVLV